MSKIVAGICASHATAQNWPAEKTKDKELYERFQAGLAQGAEIMEAAEPDVAIVIGSNHFNGVTLETVPSFLICAGEIDGFGEGGTPKGPLLIDAKYGFDLARGLTQRHFDLAISARMTVDHGITIALQRLWPAGGLPMVPIVTNTFAGPLPPLARCRELGQAIHDFIENDGQDKRVAIIGTGGLSHNLPFFPKWYATANENEDELVDLGMYARDEEREAAWTKRRLEVLDGSTPVVNPEFDQGILEMFENHDWDQLLALSDAEIDANAGNGAQEIRNWIIAAAACDEGQVRTLAYSPLVEWHTGMAVASLT